MRLVEPVVELARGLYRTLAYMFEKPVTYQYPEEKRPVRPRFRGRHVLKRYEDGLEKCIGCSLAVGPGGEILVQGPYGDAAETVSVVEVRVLPREVTGTAIAEMLSAKGYTGP